MRTGVPSQTGVRAQRTHSAIAASQAQRASTPAKQLWPSAIDIVLEVNFSDESCLSRATGHALTATSSDERNGNSSSITAQLTAYNEHVHALEEWYSRFGLWHSVGCDGDQADISALTRAAVANAADRKSAAISTSDPANLTVTPESTQPTPPHSPAAFSLSAVTWHAFFDRPFCTALASRWEGMERLYTLAVGRTLAGLHSDRLAALHYFATLRSTFLAFLQRPDAQPQMRLDEFTRVFNEVEHELRGELDVMAELHCRADELNECVVAATGSSTN